MLRQYWHGDRVVITTHVGLRKVYRGVHLVHNNIFPEVIFRGKNVFANKKLIKGYPSANSFQFMRYNSSKSAEFP